MKWYNKTWFTIIMLIVFFPVGLFLMWKNEHFKKSVRIAITVFFALVIVVGMFSGDDENSVEEDAIEEDIEEKELEAVDTEVTTSLDYEVKEDSIELVVNTNAVDGSIFEMMIIDSDINLESAFFTVEDGVAKGSLYINPDWQPGYLTASGSMRFNLDDHPQPESVKEIYGENGEHLTGKFTVENNLDGYNVQVETVQIAYPNEEEASQRSTDELLGGLNELIDSTDGILMGINPRFEDNEWGAVHVTVSDAWYNSPEHEKERFAETVSDSIKNIIYNSGTMESGETILVYFFDAYDKELASPKMLGGYKIKR